MENISTEETYPKIVSTYKSTNTLEKAHHIDEELRTDSQPSLPTASGKKFDAGKSRLDLIPAVALEEIGQVLSFGAKKYDSWNWAGGIAYSRLLGAALRHLYAYARGENTDRESGLSHLSHAGCCIVFLIWMNKFRKDLDDRHPDPEPK